MFIVLKMKQVGIRNTWRQCLSDCPNPIVPQYPSSLIKYLFTTNMKPNLPLTKRAIFNQFTEIKTLSVCYTTCETRTALPICQTVCFTDDSYERKRHESVKYRAHWRSKGFSMVVSVVSKETRVPTSKVDGLIRRPSSFSSY